MPDDEIMPSPNDARFKHPLSDTDFWSHQRAAVYEPHVEPVNRFVDSLAKVRAEDEIPYVAPVHGGVQARVLSILRDPGPATRRDLGTGLISVLNPDQTAAKQLELFAHEGIDLNDVTPWNAYPWYINRAPTTTEKVEGARVMRLLLDLLPNLEVVFLQGADAAETWRKLERIDPDVARKRDMLVIKSFHPSQQALWHKDPLERSRRKEARREAYRQLGSVLRGEVLQPAPIYEGKGSEARIEEAFAAYLTSEGWEVQLQVDYVDVIGTKGGRTLKAEVKGWTGANSGLDVDTMFGQILRRFPGGPDERFRAAVVVPMEALAKVRRVPGWVLLNVGIDVYTVDRDGHVERHELT